MTKVSPAQLHLLLSKKTVYSIIDDYKGRKYAEQLGIKITGTLGVIINAKLSGHLESVKLLLERIKMTGRATTHTFQVS